MDLSVEKKEQLEQQIVDVISSSLEAKKIKEEDLSLIATDVLKKIDLLKTEEDYIHFLRELSSLWPIFDGLYEMALGSEKQKEEKEAITQVENLVESGNLDQALAVAKQATAPTQQ